MASVVQAAQAELQDLPETPAIKVVAEMQVRLVILAILVITDLLEQVALQVQAETAVQSAARVI